MNVIKILAIFSAATIPLALLTGCEPPEQQPITAEPGETAQKSSGPKKEKFYKPNKDQKSWTVIQVTPPNNVGDSAFELEDTFLIKKSGGKIKFKALGKLKDRWKLETEVDLPDSEETESTTAICGVADLKHVENGIETTEKHALIFTMEEAADDVIAIDLEHVSDCADSSGFIHGGGARAMN